MGSKRTSIMLSKSSFIKGIQCEKHLYLYKHYYSMQDKISREQRAVFDRGNNVGKLAQQLFPGGIDMSPASPLMYASAVKMTAQKISEGHNILYEPAFIYDEVLVYVDILVKKNGRWHMYEVKSSTSVSETYLLDAAVQYYVLSNYGLNIEDVSIVFMNNQYVKNGELDINQLFTIESVINQVLELQEFIPGKVKRFCKMLRSRNIPDIDIGPQCNDPYPCSFLGYCWKNIPEYSVFNIAGLKSEKKFELYNEGIVHIDDIPDDYKLSDSQRMQVDLHKSGKALIDSDALREFTESIKYPLYFMDFETFMPAVPLYDNSRPYQQIPFQYALYYQTQRESEPEFFEYLGHPSEDSRIPFIESLLKHTEKEGQIMVYNKAFEVTRLKELARDFPQYASDIEERIERIVDLLIPFRSRYYYKPEMKGSYSIKNVLPALVPELSYDKLSVSDGGIAMLEYESLLYETDPLKISAIRNNLLEYCKLDTYGMIKVWEVISKFN